MKQWNLRSNVPLEWENYGVRGARLLNYEANQQGGEKHNTKTIKNYDLKLASSFNGFTIHNLRMVNEKKRTLLKNERWTLDKITRSTSIKGWKAFPILFSQFNVSSVADSWRLSCFFLHNYENQSFIGSHKYSFIMAEKLIRNGII